VLLAAVEILIATWRWGPVVAWDSTVYLDFSRDPTTAALFSPFYPLLLRTLATAGPPRLQAARYLAAALFGATVALAIASARRASRGTWTPSVAGLLVLTSWVFLDQYVKVMSDPLALFLGFAGLFLVARHLEDPRRWRLLLAASAVGLALAARYASLPFLVAGGFALARNPREGKRIRFLDAALFAGIAALPQAAWMVRNLAVTGNPVHREIALHPPARHTAILAIQILSTWFLPPRVPAPARLVFLGGIAVAVAWLLLYDRRHPAPAPRTPFAGLLCRFLIFDIAFMVFVMEFVDASVTVDRRHWLPVHLGSLLLVALLLDGPLQRASSSTTRTAVVVALSGFLAVSAAAAGAKCLLLARDGEEYAGRRMQTSVIRVLRDPEYRTRPIYADDPEAVSFLIDLRVNRLPSRFDPMTGKGNPAFRAEVEAVKQDIRLHDGVVVRFEDPPTPRTPTVLELEGAESLVTIARDDTVTIRGPGS